MGRGKAYLIGSWRAMPILRAAGVPLREMSEIRRLHNEGIGSGRRALFARCCSRALRLCVCRPISGFLSCMAPSGWRASAGSEHERSPLPRQAAVETDFLSRTSDPHRRSMYLSGRRYFFLPQPSPPSQVPSAIPTPRHYNHLAGAAATRIGCFAAAALRPVIGFRCKPSASEAAVACSVLSLLP